MLKCFEVIGVPSRKQLFSISYVLDGGESFFLKKKNKLLDRKIKAKKKPNQQPGSQESCILNSFGSAQPRLPKPKYMANMF